MLNKGKNVTFKYRYNVHFLIEVPYLPLTWLVHLLHQWQRACHDLWCLTIQFPLSGWLSCSGVTMSRAGLWAGQVWGSRAPQCQQRLLWLQCQPGQSCQPCSEPALAVWGEWEQKSLPDLHNFNKSNQIILQYTMSLQNTGCVQGRSWILFLQWNTPRSSNYTEVATL